MSKLYSISEDAVSSWTAYYLLHDASILILDRRSPCKDINEIKFENSVQTIYTFGWKATDSFHSNRNAY